jgi:AraC family transcriptional activator of tynA and feaB
MIHLQTFSTDRIPAHKRLSYWHDITRSALTPQTTEPVDRSAFCGRMTCLDLGDIRVVELNASGSTVTCDSPLSLSTAQPFFLVRMAISGEVTSIQGGRESCLRPGDFTLCDTSHPYRLSFRGLTDVIVLRITRTRLLQYIGRPEELLGVPMRGDTGLSGLVSRHLRDLWGASQDFIDHGASSRMTELTMQLLASAYSAIPQARADRSCLATGRRAQAIEYIERHLSDPALSPPTIATALHVTPAYLHKIFSVESETVSRYILRRRLQECARALKDRSQAKRNITDIAFAFGFNSLPHFCRVFKELYGANPSEFRHN